MDVASAAKMLLLSFGQLAAGCLAILEMAVDDRRCPHSLIHFGAISVDWIMSDYQCV